MTTQEKLQKIEQQIRKDIPRLMKPTEGCLVKYDNDIYKIVKYSGEFNLIVYQGESDVLQPLTKRIHEYSIPSEDIIGHEITLVDLLDWFGYCNTEGEEAPYYVHVDMVGNFIFEEFGESIDGLGWNMDSIYLKDQSEELINFLHNLINQQYDS